MIRNGPWAQPHMLAREARTAQGYEETTIDFLHEFGHLTSPYTMFGHLDHGQHNMRVQH